MFCVKAKYAILRAGFGGHGDCMKKRLVNVFGVLIALMLGAQTASAASAAPLSQVKVLKVESPACGFEDISEGQEKTRCDHNGPSIKIYVLEVGYGRAAQVGLDGFEVNGTRTPVCAFDNGNLTECTVGRKTSAICMSSIWPANRTARLPSATRPSTHQATRCRPSFTSSNGRREHG